MEEGLTEESQEEKSYSKWDKGRQRESKVSELSEYQVLEQTYHNVLAQMDEKEGMETFAQAYTQLFKAFYKAHAHEEELMNKNEILQAQVETNTAKMAVAESLAAAYKEVMYHLKSEIEQAQKTLDSAHVQEENSQQVIEKLRQQIYQLNAEMEQRVRLGLDPSEESGSAMKDRGNFLTERECLMHEIVILKEQLSGALTVPRDLERNNSAADLRCNELTQELERQEDEVTRLHTEAAEVGKMGKHYVKKLIHAENQRESLEQEKQKLKGIIDHLEKDLCTAKKQAKNNRSTCDDLHKNKEILKKNILRAAGGPNAQKKLLKQQEQMTRDLQKEIENLKLEANKHRKMIESLERERDRYIFQSHKLAQKIQDILDEVQLQQKAIFNYKKKIAETDIKFQVQENQIEAIQSERNTFRKKLLEAQDQISELKQKLKIMSHQTEQFHEIITKKERQIMKEEHALLKSEKDILGLKTEIGKLKDELQDSKEQITAFNSEEKKLHKIIQDADEKCEKQKKEMEQMMNERDILGTQLASRNGELSSLYEKIKILESTLHNGEAQYDQRLEDIRLLKLEIQSLRQEKNTLLRGVTNMTDMRQEIFHLERDLTQEKLKCRALEEELQTPLNIHRWRKLEGSDPTRYELIQKSQLLQKRLLAKAERAIKQEAQLQESERLYLNLREVLAHQPDPRVVMKCQETQRVLKCRDKEMKCLVSELSMYKAQVSEYKSDLEKVNKELQDMKKKYFAQKWHMQKVNE